MKELTNINLPNNWIIAQLSDMVIDPKSDFVDGPFGSNLKANEYKDEGVPVFRIQNIKAGYFLDKNIQFVTPQKAEQIKRHSFKFGDIIITKLGEPLGLCCKVPAKYPSGIIVADLMRVRPSNIIINTDYLVYAINSRIIQDQFKRITKGTTRARVNLTIVRDIEIPLAPIYEQSRIVDKLDELLSELEKGKEQLQTSLIQLKIYRQSILKHAFEGKLSEEWRKKQNKLKTPDELVAEIKDYRKKQYERQLKEYKAGKTKVKSKEPKDIIPVTASEIKSLPELPNGWTYVKISSLGDIETGTTPSKAKPEYYGDKYPFYKPTELDAGYNVRKAKEFLSESGIKQARFLPVNSILVTSIGATIGKTGIIRVAGASNQQINAIVPHGIFNSNFLYFQAVGQRFQDQIQSNAVATTLPILNKSKFEKLVFAICSQEEQNFIVDDIESKFSNIEKMQETIVQNLEVSNTLKQSLLQKAFEGKLVEQNTADESASALLERIKKVREEYLKAEKDRKKSEKPLYIKPRNMAQEFKRIIEIQKENKEPVSAKSLWQSSIHKDDIDDFYAELKKHIEAGEIVEVLPRNGKESILKLADVK